MARSGGFPYVAILLILCIFQMTVVRGQSTHPIEANALNAIKARLIDPINNLKKWNRGDPCTSNWTGVICHKISSDTYLHVTELELFKMNLSGTLAPEIGLLSQLRNLNFMWNNLTGNIPKEIGNITTLNLIALNGNQLSGSLPDEIGYLKNLNRLQIDQNQISGPLPKSFANLTSIKHLHMNNNSLSGQIPSELSRLPELLHLLVDANNLSGPLPPKLAETRSLKIIQADNNNFSGSSIPDAYNNIRTLLKLSLRNCSLQGFIPDLSGVPELGYLDLSWNQLTGSIAVDRLASNITTINSLDTIPAAFEPPKAVIILISGNPVCDNPARAAGLCQPKFVSEAPSGQGTQVSIDCASCPMDKNYEYNPLSPIPCICAAPLGVGFRLKSPGISDFRSYKKAFEMDSTYVLNLSIYQLYIERYTWEAGPRLNMHLKLFPNNTNLFTMLEVVRLRQLLAGWEITLLDIFGPYELLNFTLGSYADEFPEAVPLGLKKGTLAGILAGTIIGAIAVSVVATFFIMRRRSKRRIVSRPSILSRLSIKVDGVRSFTLEEMATATNNFNDSAEIGLGGYGKVYKGNLADGATVAIKRAHEDSLQGSNEFVTEIELLSRLHHRNLVSLIGYCDEEVEQMLVYEFMPNGTLRDHLSETCKQPLNFSQRLNVALGAAKGILYLHTDADPPIFHRDVKTTNILLDSKFIAKVADFGLSKLAPIPDVEGTLAEHISTVVKGTPGYLDPEYFLTNKLTEKSDVYSLGVVLLELLTGMKPIQFGKNIVREVKAAYQSGDISRIIDSRMSWCPPEFATRFLLLALKCCQDDTDARPYMADIARELDDIRSALPGGEDLLSVTSMETGSLVTLTPSTSNSIITITEEHFDLSHTSGSGLMDSGVPSRMAVTPR
ncbi:hypothetical protein VPH35_045966 [Triticum aestivum]|uniref:non-specific serine/threonine protein kinase n=2 Tax=Triticum turgidum subsp. durum TaxID=4567 RepID=A0A9R0RSE3_TRITD|nr:unnamed protein product [Triticum turgidum subsp. durum]